VKSRGKKRHDMKKIYILPNLITTANLVCGFLSMIHSIQGDFVKATWLIVVAAVFDSLDGRVARMAKATSAFGVQYDSLSDLTSFGIAPAIMLYSYALNGLDRFGISVAAFYAICAALRLARFNVSAEEKDPTKLGKIRKGYFQGMPSPASAGIIVSTVMLQQETAFFSDSWLMPFLAVLGLMLALLMVSNIPFPSFKEVNWRSKGKAWILLIPIVFILSVVQVPEITLFSTGMSYLILGLGWAAYVCLIRDKKQQVGANGATQV
jgi:CDP-diacylglycerol--serine O-phosphatidyltransferase